MLLSFPNLYLHFLFPPIDILYNLLYNIKKEVFSMQAVAYSNFRKDMKTYMKKVNEDSDAIIVTSKNIEDTVVVMSKKDYDSMQETMRILSNPYLMEKIRKGDEQFENSTFETHELFEVENDE